MLLEPQAGIRQRRPDPELTATYTLTCTGAGGSSQASITITVGAAAACHLYTSGSSIPAGFGVPWHVANPSSILLKAQCSGARAFLEVGDGNALMYVYKSAYLARPGSSTWTPVSLLGSGLVSDAWFPKTATAIVTMTQEELAQTSHYVAYTCSSTRTSWKCGCRDSACTQSYWQVQGVRR